MDSNITTLKVKNIPNFILKNKEKVEELCKQFGGIDIRPYSNSSQFNGYAFINFPNRQLASLASVRIQQISFEPNKYLSVEFAIPDQDRLNKINSLNSNGTPSYDNVNNLLTNTATTYSNNISFNTNEIQTEYDKNPSPIAPELGLDYPSMPTLKYKYPPPNPDIIINIMNAIVAVPKLYTQVIHLMNKMNLPPPFGEATTMTPMLYNYFYKNKVETRKRKKNDALLSSDESELESDDNINEKEEAILLQKENIPIHDVITTSTHLNKKTKISSSQNEIQIKINVDSNTSNDDPNVIKSDVQSHNNQQSTMLLEPNKNCIPLDVLQNNKISQEEMEKLPAYRNYKEGIPSRTLFLKNINVKLTKEKDLQYIFGRYLKDEEMEEKLNIRLMTSGRMKGQAFVKLPSIEMASILLKEVHGYILNEKAIIIQYGKASD